MHRAATALGNVIAVLAVISVAVGLVAAVATPVATQEEHIVNMENFAFVPEGGLIQGDVTIQVGDSVTWIYADATGCDLLNGPAPLPECPGHSTTSDDGVWDSMVFGKSVPPSDVEYPDNKYSVTFTEPGTYHYICTVHAGLGAPGNSFQGMQANVVVEGEAIPAPDGGGGEGSGPLADSGGPEAFLVAFGALSLYASFRLRRWLRASS